MSVNAACPNFNLISDKYAATASVFAQTTVTATTTGSLGCACATVCQNESLCAFFTVTAAGLCNLYSTDQIAQAGTWFFGVSSSLTIVGALQFNATMDTQLKQTSSSLSTASGCVSSCSTSSNCDFATWSPVLGGITTCSRYTFASQPGTIVGFANGNPAATSSSSSSSSSSTASATSGDSTATSSGNPATTIKKITTVTTGGGAASTSSSKSTASSSSTAGAGNLQDAGNGGSSSSSSGLVVALAVIASLAVLAGLAALVFCYRQNRSKKSKAEEFVYTLPWRQHSAAAARLNNQARNTPEPRGSLDRQLSVNGAGTAPSASPQPMLYPPAPAAAAYGFPTLNPTLNPYAMPVVAVAPQVAFTKEQYIEAGWTVEQLQVYHPELFVDGGAAPVAAAGSEAGTVGRGL
ncbi:hypothetical protein DFJ73DRAFT_251792 [Zopfochytrium polystomum]|nr:hypothetical protein DFJ73DRAFT_251792 [Zopfochytrium polystomum]